MSCSSSKLAGLKFVSVTNDVPGLKSINIHCPSYYIKTCFHSNCSAVLHNEELSHTDKETKLLCYYPTSAENIVVFK